MADTKISALTALAAADVDTAADFLPIVDTGATATKKITVDNLRTAMGPKLETPVATTSGTNADFTSAPAWAKKITVMLSGVSSNGTSPFLLQIGDSGGVENATYASSAFNISVQSDYTTGFGLMTAATAAVAYSGSITLSLLNSSTNLWVAEGTIRGAGSGNCWAVTGDKALSGTLDRVRLTTVNGTDEFDAGSVNVIYE